MKRSIQYCWRNDACQKANCKFVHRKDSPQYCWQKDTCDKVNCKFTHPRDFNVQSRQEDNTVEAKSSECLQSESIHSASKPSIEHGSCSTQNKSAAPREDNGPNELEEVSKPITRNRRKSVRNSSNSMDSGMQLHQRSSDGIPKIKNSDSQATQNKNARKKQRRKGLTNQPPLKIEPESKIEDSEDAQRDQQNDVQSTLPKDSAVRKESFHENSSCRTGNVENSACRELSASNGMDVGVKIEPTSPTSSDKIFEQSKTGAIIFWNSDLQPHQQINNSPAEQNVNAAKKRNRKGAANPPHLQFQPQSKGENFVAVQRSQQNDVQSTHPRAAQVGDAVNLSKTTSRYRSSLENSNPRDSRKGAYATSGSFIRNGRNGLSDPTSTNDPTTNRTFGPIYPSTAQIQPEWTVDESDAIFQHRNIIESIRDKISQIILSTDYSTDYEKHEANIRILRENIIDLESHVFIFDSVKSRASRELFAKPTELRNQIFREIYRFKCRLGAFAKRLDMEKYFTSGHRFLIVQGQTGSGKSTQIPQYIADHPRFYGKKIVCTQPRKLAAISLARRVAFEYSGGIVRNDSFSYIGYQVGGDRRVNNGCRIEFVTEGVMLERIMKGDMESFKNVGCIIIDEAHERSITCDLLLGSFKKPDSRWKDLLIITTSATIDLTFFSEFFNNAPTVQIEGRTFPVDIIYQPVGDESDLQFSVMQCALQIHLNCKSSPGDVLCFLPGLEDISNAKAMFERELRKIQRTPGLMDAKVFTLYGKQDPDKQAEVFEKLDSSTKRKIIFATDVAETSITIDGVVYVVDSGVKKEIVFDAERNISSLKINSISKSSAIQRAGRCGRTQPGVCYRLYSQDEFESMNINAAPEVLCKPISLAVLTLLELSVDPNYFDWISPPSKEAVSNAEKELTILGAVDGHRKPTELGNLIAKCQQDPKIMKIVYSGCVKGFGEAACSVASILSVSNTFFWNGNDAESKAKAMQRRRQFAMPEGDIVTMYRIFDEFESTYNGRKIKKLEADAVTVVNKPASVWCSDNSLNAKSMFMALTTKTELVNQLKKMKIWTKFRSQDKRPSNADVQELMCSGYFIQCARVFYSKNINTPVEYFSTESSVAGRLDFRSSLNLLDVEPPPKWIVYDKIVRLPNTIFPIASVMDENWLKEVNFDFYQMCLKKVEDLPTDLIVKSISQVSFRMIVGRNFGNVDALEKELSCLLTGDADTGQMHLYCAPIKRTKIEELIQGKIDDALTEIKKQVIEDNYIGETRVVIGEGYKVHEILFEKEFATFYIKNVTEDFDKVALKYILTMNNERLASLDCTYHDKMSTAVAKFSSKKDAKSAFERFAKIDGLTVAPSYGVSNGTRHGLTCRLKLSWPTAISKGVANVFFNSADGANQFLDNVHYIYPNAVVHVSGETQRNAQLKLHGLRPKVVQPPLIYLQQPRYQRGCRFRFDVDAIDRMANKRQLNYKVTLTSLQPSVDTFELMTTLGGYAPKNVIFEYENFAAPDIGNGLTAEEKSFKLKPLRRFIDAGTKTSDFFKRNTGVAGICIFFTSNSIAKEAYNHAKAEYSALRTNPLLAPHRLEIEFTHTISIQTGLYTFLQSQINALQKEARDKGITSITAPIQDNSKTIIVRFHTGKHSLLGWIQEKLDELIRPTKFNCPHSDVLFKWTGRLELMKFAKKTYINWSDESHIIWVYGSAEVKENGCKEIEKIANRLHSLDVLDQEIWLNRTVRINGKEGRNITNKCKETRMAFYHFQGNKMYVSGSQGAVDAVVQFLAQNKYSWDRTKGNRFKYEETRECGLCAMPPDNTFIMLTVCGHLFCSDCIEPMVNMQPPPFPIKCPMCEEYVALHDIKKLAPTKSLEKVLEMAVRAFQQNNSYDIRECPNPGCHQLLCYQQRTTGE